MLDVVLAIFAIVVQVVIVILFVLLLKKSLSRWLRLLRHSELFKLTILDLGAYLSDGQFESSDRRMLFSAPDIQHATLFADSVLITQHRGDSLLLFRGLHFKCLFSQRNNALVFFPLFLLLLLLFSLHILKIGYLR